VRPVVVLARAGSRGECFGWWERLWRWAWGLVRECAPEFGRRVVGVCEGDYRSCQRLGNHVSWIPIPGYPGRILLSTAGKAPLYCSSYSRRRML
jgi:hypothetical protein